MSDAATPLLVSADRTARVVWLAWLRAELTE